MIDAVRSWQVMPRFLPHLLTTSHLHSTARAGGKRHEARLLPIMQARRIETRTRDTQRCCH